MNKTLLSGLVVLAGAAALLAQTQRNLIEISGGERPAIAVPDFRGSGDAQARMAAFNARFFEDLQDSGQFRMVPKTVMPLHVPQQPSDFHPPSAGSTAPWLTDWSSAPVSANYLAFGYTAIQQGQLALFGWLYDVRQPNLQNAQLIGKVYLGSPDDAGARSVADQFAADILARFGASSLAGTKIYFVSDRTGHKEIWSMDYDGSNQKQITDYRSITTFPIVSPDGTKLAFTSFLHNRAEIFMFSLQSGRRLPFFNQNASLNAASDFTPDSQHLLLYSTASGGVSQIFESDLDGGNFRRITGTNTIEVEPKMNPKGSSYVFVSGRGGQPQIYMMNSDGLDASRLTTGEGEAVNPSWNPDGIHIAFAWTRGFEPGNYNIFVMDVGTREFQQLTHGVGRNENPNWAPDGVHLVYSSRRGRTNQIWTMLADGTGQHQLTTQGTNEKPVWGKAVN